MSPRDVARRAHAKPAPVDVSNLPTLQPTDIANETVEQLKARGAAYVTEYVRIEKAPTILLRNIAAVVVALRLRHDDPLGRTQAYRDEAADMYRLANIPADSKESTQAAVRWHIGAVLRDVLPSEELKALSLKTTKPVERQATRRALNAALVKSATASAAVEESTPKRPSKAKSDDDSRVPEQAGHDVRATADHLRLAKAGVSVFQQLDVSVIDEHMTDGQRAKLDDELAELQKLIAKLRRHTKKRSSQG